MAPRKSYHPIGNIYRGEASISPIDGWVGILEKDPNLIHFVRCLRSIIHGFEGSLDILEQRERYALTFDIPDINVKIELL